MFPPRAEKDWPAILAEIPLGYGLRVPVSLATATFALWRLSQKGLISRHEYVVNKDGKDECVVYHFQVFLGEPFEFEPISRRQQHSKEYWDRALQKVLSGGTIIVEAPYMVAYQALYRRLQENIAHRIHIEKVIIDGKERVVLRRK